MNGPRWCVENTVATGQNDALSPKVKVELQRNADVGRLGVSGQAMALHVVVERIRSLKGRSVWEISQCFEVLSSFFIGGYLFGMKRPNAWELFEFHLLFYCILWSCKWTCCVQVGVSLSINQIPSAEVNSQHSKWRYTSVPNERWHMFSAYGSQNSLKICKLHVFNRVFNRIFGCVCHKLSICMQYT